ncbi:hypothetical protein MMC31_007998, partial [Peltigera leucophlebia]|nr:hypothetical protein [Peltigera leucophlebia]
TTDVEVQAQLDSGLRLPVESELSTRIQRQSVWFGETLDSLLDEILGDSQATIEVQDHAKLSLNKSTLTKTYREVRIRFNIPLADRGCPWNCLEFRDQLSGFKGPLSLRQGEGETDIPIHQWNVPIVDQRLLVSEIHSGSTAHVDVGFATWVSCLAGKKTFWVRTPLVEDQQIWKDFDIDNDHRFFEEPVFPPGKIHVVYTEEDSIFCGGHFLTLRITSQFLRVLGQCNLTLEGRAGGEAEGRVGHTVEKR